MSLYPATVLRNPERNRAAFFICFFGLVVLLLRSWLNSNSLNDEEYGIVVGIDLGDDCARVAYYEDSTDASAIIVTAESDTSCVPPCVAFTDKGGVLVGHEALLQAETDPRRTVCGVQKLTGRQMPSAQPFIGTLSYSVAEGHNAKPVVTVNIGGRDKIYSPEELAGMLLSKLRELAEARLGKKITHAVVSVPRVDEVQDQAIEDAGAHGGLTVLRVVNSYTAATIGYGRDEDSDERKLVIYDIGSDILRVTVLEVDAGVFEILHTISASLDEWAAALHNGDLPLEGVMKPLKEALEKIDLTASDIHDIILTGSSSHNLKLRSAIRDFFNGQEPATDMGDEAVVVGIAKYAARFAGYDSSCCGCGNWELTRLSFSIATHDGLARVLIPRNSMAPLRRSHLFRTTSNETSTAAIKIYEGERVFARDNRLLGELQIEEVPSGVSIEVVLEVDADTMLHATAAIPGGRSVSLSNLIHTTKYDENWIERAVMEAESFGEADRATAEALDARRDLDSYLLAVQNLGEEWLERATSSSGAPRRTVQDAIRKARDWISQAGGATKAQDFYKQKEILGRALGELGSDFVYEQVYRVGGPGRFEESNHYEL